MKKVPSKSDLFAPRAEVQIASISQQIQIPKSQTDCITQEINEFVICVVDNCIPQSQRDCVTQPRVATQELPWEKHIEKIPNPNGVAADHDLKQVPRHSRPHDRRTGILPVSIHFPSRENPNLPAKYKNLCPSN
jgi:hypothetical protein